MFVVQLVQLVYLLGYLCFTYVSHIYRIYSALVMICLHLLLLLCFFLDGHCRKDYALMQRNHQHSFCCEDQ